MFTTFIQVDLFIHKRFYFSQHYSIFCESHFPLHVSHVPTKTHKLRSRRVIGRTHWTPLLNRHDLQFPSLIFYNCLIKHFWIIGSYKPSSPISAPAKTFFWSESFRTAYIFYNYTNPPFHCNNHVQSANLSH